MVELGDMLGDGSVEKDAPSWRGQKVQGTLGALMPLYAYNYSPTVPAEL